MRRGKLSQALSVGGIAVLALVVTIGCAARTRYLTVRPPQVLSWEGQPLPLTAALMVSESVRAATDQEQVNCPFSTTSFVFQTGTAFERGAMQVLAPVFNKVDLVREKPKPGQYDLVIEPNSPDVELQGHCQLFQNEKPTLDGRSSVLVRVYDRRDRPLLDATFSSGTHTDTRVLDVVGKAMGDMLQAMAAGLASAPKIQSYAGLAPSAVASQPSEPEERKGSESRLGPQRTVEKAIEQKPIEQKSVEQRPVEPRVDPPKRVHTPLPLVPADSSRPVVTGAGFAVGYGYVITAYHLLAGMSYASVSHHDKTLPATVVLRDRLSDVALLKVEDGGLDGQAMPGLRLGDGTKVKVNDRVWACDLSSKGTDKPIWKEGRVRPTATTTSQDPRFFPLFVASAPQHSGGPVLNDQGEVVGILVAQGDVEQLFPNLGQLPPDHAVAIKVQYAKWLLSMLPESEFVMPPSIPRSLPVSTMIENARPQVVVVKTASR
jgi:S1-C subfamily serine protease